MKYPFTPEVLDALPEELAELFRGLEDTLITEICSRLKLAGELNEVTVQDIKSLRAMGLPLEDIEKAIRETAKISREKLDALFDDVIERNQTYYTELIDKAGVTQPAAIVSGEEIEAIRRQTKDEFTNLTQSMGFLVRRGGNVVEILPAARAYQWALDRAQSEIMSGAISYNQAIKSAVKTLADGGVRRARYDKDGKTRYDQIDVAVRRAVMTGINQVCQKYSEQSMERLETDLVEVSAHRGARNTGSGPENHAAWQGKVYQWIKEGRKRNRKYPDFVQVTGYGTGPGLGGWNCRHNFSPFVENVMERSYTNLDLEKIDLPPFEYEGKTYDQYHASQKQREIERTLRKLRREQAAFHAAGATEDSQATSIRIRMLNDQYKQFSKKAGLPMQKERAKVLYP